MYFFTADEHYYHTNVIKLCNRPFFSIEEMNAALIANHNHLVKITDTVIHAGDFTLKGKTYAKNIIKQLNGNHIFLKGSHDSWLSKTISHEIWEKTIEEQHIVVCHYAMRVWGKSHYGSWQLYGHSHGQLPPIGLQYDIGVDNNNFFPVPFQEIKFIMKNREQK